MKTSSDRVLGGDDGWKIRFNLKNPKTGKNYEGTVANKHFYTEDELNKMSGPERVYAKERMSEKVRTLSQEEKELYDKDAKKVLDWLIAYFKRDGEQYVQMEGQGFNKYDGHYYFTDGVKTREPFKHLAGGEWGEADFTIYLGSKLNVEKFISAAKLDKELMKLLTSKGGKVNQTDVMLDDFFSGRFEGRQIGFSGYSNPNEKLAEVLPKNKLIPFLKTKEGIWYVNSEEDKVKFVLQRPGGSYQSDNLMRKNYTDLRHALAQALFGEYVTGTKHKKGGQINYNKLRK